MTERFVKHDTFVIEREYKANPKRVFTAWSDPEQKAQWFPKAEKFEFVVGGREWNQGGPPGGATFTYDAFYQEIVQDQRIVYTYTMDMDQVRISASIVSVELKPVNVGTRLIFTEQVAMFDGHDRVEYRQQGTEAFLDKLESLFQTGTQVKK
ncbi:SRPBCC family protein [Shimazuella kribbensis]|uniref:SRPBCC family protein n=1 Tax=Shimazuella kribbensis TaxID=139808 RepID=UPI0003F9DB58|nr:SRPBCC family protein [Shimazuella kribbensis]